MCLIDSNGPPHLPFPQNHAKREPMVLCKLCKELPMTVKAKKATDVGLEPTASALGGLRATIAPTGQLLVVEESGIFVSYITKVLTMQTARRQRFLSLRALSFLTQVGQVRLSTFGLSMIVRVSLLQHRSKEKKTNFFF